MSKLATEDTVEKVLPCPFCGGIGHPYERDLRGTDLPEGIVECGTCGCEMTGLSIRHAIEQWNTRAAINAMSDVREALERLVEASEPRRVKNFDPDSRVTVIETRTKDILEFHEALDAALESLSGGGGE